MIKIKPVLENDTLNKIYQYKKCLKHLFAKEIRDVWEA